MFKSLVYEILVSVVIAGAIQFTFKKPFYPDVYCDLYKYILSVYKLHNL